MTVTYPSEHGARTVGRCRIVDSGWLRADTYVNSDGDTFHEDWHAAGSDDVSNIHSIDPKGYDPKCGWCQLGASHTADAHTAKLEQDVPVTDREYHVTDVVSSWLVNEGDAVDWNGHRGVTAEVAATFAWAGDLRALEAMTVHIIKWAHRAHAAWHVRQELAANDYRRIRWSMVAAELKSSSPRGTDL